MGIALTPPGLKGTQQSPQSTNWSITHQVNVEEAAPDIGTRDKKTLSLAKGYQPQFGSGPNPQGLTDVVMNWQSAESSTSPEKHFFFSTVQLKLSVSATTIAGWRTILRWCHPPPNSTSSPTPQWPFVIQGSNKERRGMGCATWRPASRTTNLHLCPQPAVREPGFPCPGAMPEHRRAPPGDPSGKPTTRAEVGWEDSVGLRPSEQSHTHNNRGPLPSAQKPRQQH